MAGLSAGDPPIGCDELAELARVVARRGIGLGAAYGIAKLAAEGIGRVAMARALNSTERRVRRILEALKGDPKVSRILPTLAKIVDVERRQARDVTVTIYRGLRLELLEAIRRNIVSFRDELVIAVKGPWAFEALGIVEGGAIAFPGMPEELSASYAESVGRVEGEGLVVVWRRYRGVSDDAAVVEALAAFCSRSGTP